MKISWMLALAAATALVPAAAMAQDRGPREGRGFQRTERSGPRFERPAPMQSQRPVRPAFRNDTPRPAQTPDAGNRFNGLRGGFRNDMARPAPSPDAANRFREQRQGFRAERRDDRRDFRVERRDDRQGFRAERAQDGQALRQGLIDRQQFQQNRQVDRRDFRQDRREDRRDFRNDRRDDRRDLRQDNGRRPFAGQNERRWYGDNSWGRGRDGVGRDWNRGGYARGGWNRDWRRDGRYDWRGYRNANRSLYRLPRYYAPRGWFGGYQRFGIGFSLSSALFAPDYWIDDPFAYRLPLADGPFRWVRYYNDALLVDLETGEVVDVEYDIFW